MRRWSRILALIGVLVTSTAVLTPTSAPAEPAAASIGRTAYVTSDWPNGDITVQQVNLDGSPIPDAPVTTLNTTEGETGDIPGATETTEAYPSVGPYEMWRWRKLWRNPTDGMYHPQVCVDNVGLANNGGPENARFPLQTATGAWSQEQFRLWYESSGGYDPLNGTATCNHSAWPDYARMDVSLGTSKTRCSHTFYLKDADYKIERMIGYMDYTNTTCGFLDAELKAWRTARLVGQMIGVKFHTYTAPSCMGPAANFIWPQWWNDRTVGWYN